MKKTNPYLQLLGPLLRGSWFIAICISVAVFAAARYAQYATPVYESTARLKLADKSEGVPHQNLYKDFDLFVTSNKIAAEVELIKSSYLIDKALDSLEFDYSVFREGQLSSRELYTESPFLVRYSFSDSSILNRDIKIVFKASGAYKLSYTLNSVTVSDSSVLGRTLVTPHLTITLDSNKKLYAVKPKVQLADNYKIRFHSRNTLIKDIAGNLDVGSVEKEVPVLRITYKNTVPNKTTDLVNALAQAYVQDYVENRTATAKLTAQFIDKQLNKVGNELSSSENNIEQYRNEKKITNIKQETETDLRKIADLKVQLANTRANLRAVDSLLIYLNVSTKQFLTRAPNFEAFNDLLSTELVKRIKSLQNEREQLLIKYQPDHEKIKLIEVQIEDLIAYIKEAVSNTKKNLVLKESEIDQAIVNWVKVFNDVPLKEKELHTLERDFNLNEQAYNFLASKRTEAALAQAATLAFHRVIDRAEIPTIALSPKPGLLKIVSGLLGFIIGLLIVYGFEGATAKIRTRDQIEEKSLCPIAGALSNNLDSKASELAWLLKLQGFMPERGVITYSELGKKGENMSLIQGFAKHLQADGKKVIVIDWLGNNGLSIAHWERENKTNQCFWSGGMHVLQTPQLSEKWNEMQAWADYVLVYAGEFTEASATLFALKNSDLVVVGAQYAKSPLAKIVEVDVLKASYKLENVCWILTHIPGPFSIKSAFSSVENTIKKITGSKLQSLQNRKWQTT
ncbi:MAG: GumC family protein [Flexibacteraceae bacterium]